MPVNRTLYTLNSSPICTLDVHITSNVYWCAYMQQWYMHMACLAFEVSHNHIFFDPAWLWISPFDASLSYSLFPQLEIEIFGGQTVERSECLDLVSSSVMNLATISV